LTTVHLETIWPKICQALKEQLNADVYARWIAVINPRKLEADTLVLSVSNDFYQSWLEENYLPLIKEAASRICGCDLKVVLEVHPRGFGASEQFSPKPDALYVSNAKDPQDFYLLANILDVIRGIDYAITLDQVDSRRLFVGGGSRGGYLTLALAANDPRITVASAAVPCYADLDMMGRLGYASAASDAFLAWNGGTPPRRKSLRAIWAYFDAVSLAHRIHCPIVVEAGMKDTICAVPGIVDAFNRMASPRKFLLINPEQGHSGTKPGGDIVSLLQAEAGR